MNHHHSQILFLITKNYSQINNIAIEILTIWRKKPIERLDIWSLSHHFENPRFSKNDFYFDSKLNSNNFFSVFAVLVVLINFQSNFSYMYEKTPNKNFRYTPFQQNLERPAEQNNQTNSISFRKFDFWNFVFSMLTYWLIFSAKL